MPVFDSLSFALLIPFAICFALIFVVCCFADEIKDICRMPSPLPRSYLAPEHTDRNRRRTNRRPLRSIRSINEEFSNLILNEEGRNWRVSESSTEYASANNNLAHSASNLNTSNHSLARVHGNLLVLPQTVVPNGEQREVTSSSSGVPIENTTNATTSSPSSQNEIQLLSQFSTNECNENSPRNFARNLTIHASISSKDMSPSLKQSVQCESKSDKSNTEEKSTSRNCSSSNLIDSYMTTLTSSEATTVQNTTVNETTKAQITNVSEDVSRSRSLSHDQ